MTRNQAMDFVTYLCLLSLPQTVSTMKAICSLDLFSKDQLDFRPVSEQALASSLK